MRLAAIFLFIYSYSAFPHGGDSGPSSIEEEFSKLSHIHLPVNFSTLEGLSFGYEFGLGHEGAHEGEEIRSFEIHPTAFGGYDKLKRKICLDEATEGVIEKCPESSRYLFVENKKWDLGLGVEAHTHIPIPGLIGGIGLSFLRGKNYYSFRYLDYKYEERSPLKIPSDWNVFLDWRIGDELFYSAKGSITFNVAVGIEPILHVGPLVSKSGTFRFKLKKVDEYLLMAEISTENGNAIAFEGNAIFVGGELGIQQGKVKSIKYLFDMQNEENYSRLQKLLAGRIDLLSKTLIGEEQNLLHHVNSIIFGKSASIGFGLPVFYIFGRGRGTYAIQEVIDEKEEDGKIHRLYVYAVTKVKERFSRGIFSDHLFENQTVTSTVIRDENEPSGSLLSFIVNWNFGRDHIKPKQFKRKLNKLSDLFGIKELKNIKIPDWQNDYLKVDISLNLSAEEVLKILSVEQIWALRPYQKEKDYIGLNKKIIEFMTEHFKNIDGLDELFGLKKLELQLNIEGENIKKISKKL